MPSISRAVAACVRQSFLYSTIAVVAAVLAAFCGAPGIAPAAAAEGTSWFALHPSLLARGVPAGARIGTGIYVLGGFEGLQPTNAVERYDIRTDSWSRVAPMPVALNHTAAVAYDGQLYVIDGYMGDMATFSRSNGLAVAILLRYDPARNVWTELTPPPLKRGGISAAAIGDKLYVAGGFSPGDGELTALEIYDFATGRWSRGADMAVPREQSLAAVSGSSFYVIGGRRDAYATLGDLSDTERYSPASDRWERVPSPRYARSAGCAETVGERIVVYGGMEFTRNIGQVEQFDPATGGWTRLPDMATPRNHLACASYGRRVYAIEGTGRYVHVGDTTLLEALDLPPGSAPPGSAHGGTLPRLRMSVRPRRVRAGRRVRFSIRVTTSAGGRSRPVRGALVRFAGSAARTRSSGRAVLVGRLRHTGRHRVRAGKAGFRPGRATVRVVARRERRP